MAEDKELIYDPLVEIINFYESRKGVPKKSKVESAATVEERLKNRIIDGEKQGLEADLKTAMEKYKPLDIINTLLLDGMKVVGDLFGRGEMQLPFVLQSAEVMKTAVAYLEPFMEKSDSSRKGTIVLATVKGDVHDIGKNLVDIILTNNGYKVVNLGIKCPVDTMIHAYEDHKADAIGMSGLLVKSTMIMKENLEVMIERGIHVPVLLGGAALTRRYVEEDLGSVYKDTLVYCEDAFSGLHAMEKIIRGEKPAVSTTDLLSEPADTIQETVKRIRIVRHQWQKALGYVSDEEFSKKAAFGDWSLHDMIAHFVFWQKKTAERIKLVASGRQEEVREYGADDQLNVKAVQVFENHSRDEVMDAWSEAQLETEAALHSLKDDHLQLDIKGTLFKEFISESTFAHEYEHLQKVNTWIQSHQKTAKKKAPVKHRSNVATDVEAPKPPFWGSRVVDTVTLNDVYPFINEIALFRGQWQFTRGKKSPSEYEAFVKKEVRPVFEHWTKRSAEEKLLIPKLVYGYFPCQAEENDLIVYEEDLKSERLRFSFPRQSEGNYYCISDFFAPKASGRMDVLGCMVVTVGQQASDFSAKLFESDNYADYLYFHGLSVETAEALAEYWHREIRREMNLIGEDHADTKKLFQQQYRGSRYSFGYPACPNLEDQTKLFQLLQPERIGISLTEEYHLEPEQSTSAIIVHHPQAKYFNV